MMKLAIIGADRALSESGLTTRLILTIHDELLFEGPPEEMDAVRELAELLPPGERPITRLNTSPFLINGGDGGATELPGDEFLFGYWLGRHLKLIE